MLLYPMLNIFLSAGIYTYYFWNIVSRWNMYKYMNILVLHLDFQSRLPSTWHTNQTSRRRHILTSARSYSHSTTVALTPWDSIYPARVVGQWPWTSAHELRSWAGGTGLESNIGLGYNGLWFTSSVLTAMVVHGRRYISGPTSPLHLPRLL